MTTASEHKTWAELDPITQAALRCKDPRFRAFLMEVTWKIEDEEMAAVIVRAICEVDSRRELANDLNAQAKWRGLDDLYQAWLARER